MNPTRLCVAYAPILLIALGAPLAGCGVEAPPTAEETQATTEIRRPPGICYDNSDCGNGQMGSPTCDGHGRCDSCRLNGCIFNANCTFDNRTPYRCPGCYRTMAVSRCDPRGSGQCVGCPAGSSPDGLLLTCIVVNCGIATIESTNEPLTCGT